MAERRGHITASAITEWYEQNDPRAAHPSPDASVSKEAVAWVVAVEEAGRTRVYGPQYATREAAEQDARLPGLRSQKAEVWECYRTEACS